MKIVRFFIALGLSVGLTLIAGSAFAQSPVVPSPLQSPSPSATPRWEFPNLGSSSSNVATADVRLDGRKLFTIAAPAVQSNGNQPQGTPPIRDRVNGIESTLAQVVTEKTGPERSQVRTETDPKSGLPVIYIGDRYLMTVTTLDAQIQGQDPQRWATDLTQTIQNAIATARQERQPESLVKQAFIGVQILIVALLASWVVAIAQKRLQRQRHQLSVPTEAIAASTSSSPEPTTAITAVQAQMNQRQQRNLRDAQGRLLQVLQVAIWGGSIFVVLGLFAYTRELQALIVSGPVKILGIALLTYVAIRLGDVLIDRFFSAIAPDELIAPDTSRRLALRITTFSRVLRSLVGIILIGIGILAALSALGVDLAPVIAGAGILGLAVSFASQNLIKDMINGMLILSEDQYAVGDVIQVGKVSGLVESMNLRITQLRNEEGRLITIPNSSITVVENLSKDWSRVNLAITIAYDAAVDRAIDVIRRVGDIMVHDPQWQDKIPETPEVLGVDEIGDAGITIRVWIKTEPLQQWKVAREFRRRLKIALDQEGIAIGVPQQALSFRHRREVPPELADGNGRKNEEAGVKDKDEG